MMRSPDRWRRAAPPARLGRPSITSWTGPSYTSERLIEGLRERAATLSVQLEMQSRAWLGRHKARLGLLLRVMTSALLSFEAARWLNVHMPLWAVLTAIMVTQISVGRSLKASLDYLSGTIGGAVFGAVVGILVGGGSEVVLLVGLAIAVGPLTLIATVRQSLTAAPVTAAIVLVAPAFTLATPIAAAADRVLEVALGAVIGLTISFVLFPASAYGVAIEAAARMIDRLANALGELITGLKVGLEPGALHRIQDGIGETFLELNAVGTEAERERAARLSSAPDIGPLLLTLLRLRHDLVIIGRAAASPLPETLQARLKSFTDLATAIGDFLRASGTALRTRRVPPPPRRSGLGAPLLCGGNRDNPPGRCDAPAAERGDRALLRTLLRTGAARAQFARAPSLCRRMGAIDGARQVMQPLCPRL
jgi:uncharacterized membrane protein YccC